MPNGDKNNNNQNFKKGKKNNNQKDKNDCKNKTIVCYKCEEEGHIYLQSVLIEKIILFFVIWLNKYINIY